MKNTQHTKILNYLEAHKEGLTALECAKELDITKLSTRIGEMIGKGIPIVSVRESYTNADGETSHYCRYFLAT